MKAKMIGEICVGCALLGFAGCCFYDLIRSNIKNMKNEEWEKGLKLGIESGEVQGKYDALSDAYKKGYITFNQWVELTTKD